LFAGNTPKHQTTLIQLSSNIVIIPKHLEEKQLTANIVAAFPRAPWRYSDFGWQRKWRESQQLSSLLHRLST
jgi:hypothetical protein